MGKDDVTLIGNRRGQVEEKVDVPHLNKVIKTLKDRCYAVERYAFLKEWNYYIVETKSFKLAVKQGNDPTFYHYLSKHLMKDEAIWICIDGMNFYPIMAKTKTPWGNSETDKATQCWVEGESHDRPLPDAEELMDDFTY